ncbi:hypothetical protein F4679DRAFT_583073 [Xylaria curta]|nr:hypothetical protein F4679DRAFT_583073 [Xylaria curta]
MDMANRLAGTSCLSTEPHNHNITNPLLHFLGCIEIYERYDFLNGEASIWKDELRYQRRFLPQEDAEEAVKKMKSTWESNFKSELRRIALLRHALSQDTHDKQLVEDVENSRTLWRKSAEYQKNIDKVKKWRRDKLGKKNSVLGPCSTSEMEDSIPEKDTSVPVIQFLDGQGHTEDSPGRLKGRFPNQKTTIEALLEESDPKHNLLHQDHDFGPGRIKYFHIPSNNMRWAEEAIARYYGEKRPDFGEMQRHLQRPQRTSTHMIIQDRYWRGQLHGDASSPPHARYMSPMCETISSSSVEKPNRGPKNIVLFMPYLHWETSRRREQFASEIDKIVIRVARDLVNNEAKAKTNRQTERRSLHIDTASGIEGQTLMSQKHEQRPESSENVLQNGMPQSPKYQSQFGGFANVVEDVMPKKMSRFKSENALGSYMLAAARLYEGMTTYRDRQLLRKFLPLDTPIHPRRTLDQAYYWTLKSTKIRDRDQVIYRGTTATRDAFHRYDEKNKEWLEHRELSGRDCGTCRTNIRKISRVIMVDQLWMWILDNKTLITCFPKRYGANKQDYSGVHKSIRTSLENLGSNQVRTVFELALIVLNECTTTFFDRTKSLDRRPQVLDEFSKAIGRIMHKQTGAFARLWQWTDEARKTFRAQGYMNTRSLHVPLLDINPEGKLEREIEDIIEELDIMLHISNTHQDIVKSFVEQAEHILDPDGDFRKRFKREDPGEDKEKYENYESFKLRANECQTRVDSHVKDLESLRKTAKNTADDVLHLLTMKQQQASVVQAWQAVKQSDETIKQGRSIMIFTLATIVFLPLSFLTSVFGMNNYEFGNNNWRLGEQLIYIFLISAGVVFISLLFAFSAWIRAWIWSHYSRVLTKFTTRTGIYEYVSQRRKAEEIFEETHAEIDEMKTKAKRQVFEKKIEAKGQPLEEGIKKKMDKEQKDLEEDFEKKRNDLETSIAKRRREFADKMAKQKRRNTKESPLLSMVKFWEGSDLTKWFYISRRKGQMDRIAPTDNDIEIGDIGIGQKS